MRHWLAVSLLTLCGVAFAQERPSFTIGEELGHQLSVCLDKAVAIKIIDADSKGGHEAAAKIWAAEDRCQTIPVIGPKVGQVIHTAPIKRGDKKFTAKVVEILSGGQVIGYFITSGDVSMGKPSAWISSRP